MAALPSKHRLNKKRQRLSELIHSFNRRRDDDGDSSLLLVVVVSMNRYII
jgi:hypothetical protein